MKKMELYHELLRNEKLMGMGTYQDRLKEQAEIEQAEKAKQDDSEATVFNVKGEPINIKSN